MPFHVRDPETDALVRQYAEEKRMGITDAIKLAVTKARESDERAKAERLTRSRAILAKLDAMPRTGEIADKAFFDALSGD